MRSAALTLRSQARLCAVWACPRQTETAAAAGNGITRTSVQGSVKIFDLAFPDRGTLAATVITGGVCRADAVAYDPADHLLAVTNGNDTPPFLSLIAARANPAQDKVVLRHGRRKCP
jgi:hypothetical protein